MAGALPTKVAARWLAGLVAWWLGGPPTYFPTLSRLSGLPSLTHTYTQERMHAQQIQFHKRNTHKIGLAIYLDAMPDLDQGQVILNEVALQGIDIM